jgi:hypothetical protein
MKDLRKNLKSILIQMISELPEGGIISSSKGRGVILSRMGVLDENHWGVYDRGVSVFANNLSSVIYELKKKGILSVPKPLHWGRPAVQESLFIQEGVGEVQEEVVQVEEVDEVQEEEVQGGRVQEEGDLTIEERYLKNQVGLKGLVVLDQAIKDMGGRYDSGEGGCYGGYGKLPAYICDGGLNGRGVMLRACALRFFCKKEGGV